MKKYLMLLCVLVAVIFTACTKDAQTTTKDKLTAHTWIVTDHSEDGTSLWSLYAACNRDDELAFKSDGNWSYSEGATNCSPATPTRNGTFVITSDGTKVQGLLSTECTVVELTSTVFKFSYQGTNSGGQKVTVTETYKAK